jgi:hypothetical protein
MRHILLEVMHESWVENIERVICNFLLKKLKYHPNKNFRQKKCFCRLFLIICARKSQHNFDSFLFNGYEQLIFMCHVSCVPEVMHESWVENLEQVISHIFFKNITKLHFLENQHLSTSLEFEVCQKNLFRTVHALINSTGLFVFCVYIFF